MKAKQVLLGGIVNNPVFVLVLGMCPMLAMSASLADAFWLGVSTTVVLIASNTIISLLRNIIPDKVRIPCYIVIIATLVTVVDMFLAKFAPDIYSSLGSFLKLIVVNCIILGRAEAFANSNKPHMAALDGLSMGVGFILAISLMGAIREIFGMGSILGHRFINVNGADANSFIGVISQTAGGFIILGILMAIFNKVYAVITERQKLKAAATLGAASDSNAIPTAAGGTSAGESVTAKASDAGSVAVDNTEKKV